MQIIKKAIIPAAGLGTRFLPATKAQPKEMLPIIATPTIHYVVEECVASGIEDILIVTGKGKTSIEEHFSRQPELEAHLLEMHEEALYKQLRDIDGMANIHFIRQNYLNGLGDAVHYGKSFCGQDPFAVLLGDTVNVSNTPVIKQMMDVYNRYESMVIGVHQVPLDKVSRYGVVGGSFISDRLMKIENMIEKPAVNEAPSNWAFVGRYLLTPAIFDALEHTEKGKGNEIQLTDAIRSVLLKEDAYALCIEGKRYDIGNKLEYLKTLVDFALLNPEFSSEFETYLCDLLANMDHGDDW